MVDSLGKSEESKEDPQVSVEAYRADLKRLDDGVDLNNDFALHLLELKYERLLGYNLNKFQGLSKEVALKLIEFGFSWAVSKNLDKFQGLDQEVALKLAESSDDDVIDDVADNFDKFKDLDRTEIVAKIKKSINKGAFIPIDSLNQTSEGYRLSGDELDELKYDSPSKFAAYVIDRYRGVSRETFQGKGIVGIILDGKLVGGYLSSYWSLDVLKEKCKNIEETLDTITKKRAKYTIE